MTFNSSFPAFDTKADLRRHAGAVRQHEAQRLGALAGDRIARHVLEAIPLRAGDIVAGYWPVRAEADVLPTMMALHHLGHGLCLPEVAGPGLPLKFRRWVPGAPLAAGAYSIPAPGLSAGLSLPGLVLVPGVCFDKKGMRLGYGGGFYDRTLEVLRRGRRPTVVGVAYDAQLGDRLAREPHDAVMDFVVTERRVIRTR
jgi:5-formyltetrahydrofolate cyclo-ligase